MRAPHWGRRVAAGELASLADATASVGHVGGMGLVGRAHELPRYRSIVKVKWVRRQRMPMPERLLSRTDCGLTALSAPLNQLPLVGGDLYTPVVR